MANSASEIQSPIIEQISDCTYRIAATKSSVPVHIYATPNILAKLKTDKSLQQAMNMAKLPGIVGQSIVMPDAHQGYGFPIGGVAAFPFKDGIISPGGIGFDINCGIRCEATNLTESQVKEKLPQLLDAIFAKIPVGQGGESPLHRLSHAELDIVLTKGLQWAKEKGYATQDDLERCEAGGCVAGADPLKVSPTGKARGKNQLGTLGGGNHFIEIQVVDEIYDLEVAKTFRITGVGQVLVMVHSGSRGVGHQTCSEYLRKMEDEFPQIADSLPERDLLYAPLSSQIAKDYFAAMCACANFAWTNRFLMARSAREALVEVFGSTVEVKPIYDVAHNIAKRETHVVDGVEMDLLVHRKGATRAFAAGHDELPAVYKSTGHPVLIPGSMGTSSFILVGTEKGMATTFGSTAHGSGRIMSRVQAMKDFDGEKVAADLLSQQGIIVKAPKLSAIADEAPGVYKDSFEVVDANERAGISRKIVRLRPLGVIKG